MCRLQAAALVLTVVAQAGGLRRVDLATASPGFVFEKIADPSPAFIGRSGEASIRLDGRGVVLKIAGHRALRMRMLGAQTVAPRGKESAAKINYLVGDTSEWRRDVASYSEVRYSDLYPGIGLVYYGTQGRLEYDFVVAPYADPSKIRMDWDGAESVKIGEHGKLILKTAEDEIEWDAPSLYQEVNGVKRNVAGGFRLLGGTRVGFKVGEYDRTHPLTIDPTLALTTFLGGQHVAGAELGSELTFSRGTAVDSAGNVYITGAARIISLPVTSGAFQTGYSGSSTDLLSGDAFIAKYNSSGSLVYLTYVGGRGDDLGLAIAVDTAGNAYITGYTTSFNYPVTSGAFQPKYAGAGGNSFILTGGDAFVTKLSSDGHNLVYSTFLGGISDDAGFGIAVDATGNAYVAGGTQSAGFPVTQGAAQTRWAGIGGQAIFPKFGLPAASFGDAFITKMSADGSQLIYSTFLGGSNDDAATSIAIDGSGAAYVGGSTLSRNFPVTTGAFQTQFGGQALNGNPFFNFGDGFVAKLNPQGSAFAYASYIGGRGDDAVMGVAVDSTGALYGTGMATTSDNFPFTSGAFQSAGAGPQFIPSKIDVDYGDAIVFKVNPTGSALVFSTFYGGSGDDAGMAIALDSGGNVLVTGFTSSPDFPLTQDAAQKTLGGPAYLAEGHNNVNLGSGFLVELSPSGGRSFATYLGGAESSGLFSLAVSSGGTAWLSGVATARTDALLISMTGFGNVSGGGPVISAVLNNTGEAPIIAENTWIEIKGQNLSATKRIWQDSDFVNGQMPTSLDGVRVTVNGKAAFVYYISSEQVNVLTPLDANVGPVQVQLSNSAGAAAAFTVQKQSYAPGLFQFGGSPYVAATHASGALIGPRNAFGSSTPAAPGEAIILYANGFGQTNPAIVAGVASQSGTLTSNPVVRIGGSTAAVQFAGVISPGLYQFNVVVPADAGNGDQAISISYNGLSTQAGALITIQRQ